MAQNDDFENEDRKYSRFGKTGNQKIEFKTNKHIFILIDVSVSGSWILRVNLTSLTA